MAQRMKAPAESPVEIVGWGMAKVTRAPVYGATSASEPNRLHLIIWSPTAREWECDCPRWAYRRCCRHVEALNARLANERVGMVTAKGRAALAAYNRDTSPRRGPAAFSLLKQ